jgi:hypothetical protein
MTHPQGVRPDGAAIERLCRLAQVSRAAYYRHWGEHAPRVQETALRDAIQRLAITHRHYGYRRITALLKREGWIANLSNGAQSGPPIGAEKGPPLPSTDRRRGA